MRLKYHKIFAIFQLALGLLILDHGSSQLAFADNIAPAFASDYSLIQLGQIPGLPGPYGGLTLLAGNSNELLIGGTANLPGGAICEIGLTRGAGNHITGFSGSATHFATAPYIDGGLAYGPGGVLFYSAFPINFIGEIKPGSVAPDKLVDLTPLGVASSVGALNFVPAGQPGAGDFKIVSYTGGEFYNAALTPDGFGTYNIGAATQTAITSPAPNPEGFIYVPTGSADFPTPSMLLPQWLTGRVEACLLDPDGNPTTCQDFVQGLIGAEGGYVDPLTGDFLFSTFDNGGGNKLVEVQGFVPPTTPEAGSASMLATALAGLAFLLRRTR